MSKISAPVRRAGTTVGLALTALALMVVPASAQTTELEGLVTDAFGDIQSLLVAVIAPALIALAVAGIVIGVLLRKLKNARSNT